ncbi:hypothetical protein KC343_g5915 [Hortaea werneckii]|uniref:BTB domain-containing protein n=1 Tax=Hortaea werneckii TaxID=91943 RepID=A0A3M7E3J2_HORWE|nr:hypothetical protein KC338_g775 [Hortaea werneckii]KAI7181207.1 hypothetical protein KC352_g23475 [Hortaea werneckii]KAI7562922.1 hypothetical protein KC317_g8083 [Hortaea werneckii]KAI7616703.1 hypothetical protein KC346_g5861 [Hortaea werneckii]KAI7627711.1 hypothetical protein KC343_g5915 [Hortaea werneckii]
MESSHFRAAAERLFKAGKSVDFTLICGSAKYPVHRLLLSLYSVYFQRLFDTEFKEALTGECILHDDHPAAVVLMIKYFYSFDYATDASTDNHFANQLELHAHVYVVADKYGVEDLKQLACRKFTDIVPEIVPQNLDPTDAFRLIFTATPAQESNKLRKVATTAWCLLSHQIVDYIGQAAVDKLLRDAPDLAVEIAHQYSALIKVSTVFWSDMRCECGGTKQGDLPGIVVQPCPKCHGSFTGSRKEVKMKTRMQIDFGMFQ